MRSVAILFGILAGSAANAADDCTQRSAMTGAVSSSSMALEAQRFIGISIELTTLQILEQLGPAARTICSGLLCLQWDVSDGRVFTVSTSGLCAKPHRVWFSKPPTTRD